MVEFSNDADILKYEPALFGELYLAGQVLAAGGNGVVDGTSFTAASEDFISAQVSAGGVIYLRSADGSVDGTFEIVSVDSATQLTVSVVRADSGSTAIALPAATDVSYRVSTFGPQAGEVGFQLTEYLGIRPGSPASEIGAEDILDTNVLKPVSVFAVISNAYAMLAGRDASDGFWEKSLYYRKLFERAKERCRVSIDAGSDGREDIIRVGSSVRLVRD